MYCRIVFNYDAIMAYYWINNILVNIPSIFGVVIVYVTVQVKASQAQKMSRRFREECKKGNISRATGRKSPGRKSPGRKSAN